LLELLVDGPLSAKEVKTAARDAGHAWRTIERVKSSLKIASGNKSDGRPWSLPNTLAELADIKKIKENQLVEPRHELRQSINVGGLDGGVECKKNQEVNSTPPTPPRVLEVVIS
jgi:hypothetical protein